jgi:hypothetical protein
MAGGATSRQKRDWLKVQSKWPDDVDGIEARFGLNADSPGFPDYREDFERGDKHALLLVIYTCAECRWKIPQWATVAFVDMYMRGLYAEIESWDDVFGKPWGDGRQQRTARSEAATPYIFKRVMQLHREGAPITNELFERVGEEFGISRPQVSKYYYAMRQQYRKIFKDTSPQERELSAKILKLSPKEREIYGL